ncbi:unnamed protein product [Dovyalis caffra]|uniref:Ubiquitin-like protease family profile domain-containing protein n=1 Tax=Dovyalis caffra TaxID=77055 RepID=A0AAV1SAV2_9ROSI|nr:unnamed protein product [Dovyalis caffra]
MENGLEVFDFKEEDETAELAAGKFIGKFKNPSLDNPAILKYQFLECVAQECDVPKIETGSLVCVEADAIDCDNAGAYVQSGTVGGDLNTDEGNSGSDAAPQLTCLSHEQDPCFRADDFESKGLFSEHEKRISCHEPPLLGKSQLDCGIRHCPPSSSESVDEKLDVDDHMKECSPSSPTPDIAEAGASKMATVQLYTYFEKEKGGIDIIVDYVVYRGKYCAGCLVTFSYDGIKINGTIAHGDEGTFSLKTGIDDIVSIESQNLQRFETVTIKLRILSKDAVQADNGYGMSGVEELEVAVVEPNWSRKWEEITYLNVKYSALLSVIHDTGIAMDGGVELLQQRRYFPSFDAEFEDVIYPKGDSDAVSISKRDVDLLQPETFINDTIIDFYIKKLADLDKDPSSVKDGRAAFLRVHKWTRKVDVFGKDYIFIPVNFNLHWSLLVICHPGEVAGVKEEDTEKSVKVPCILHMDSIKGTHAGLKNLVQRYLWEEWKERQKDSSEDMSSKFLNLRFVPLEKGAFCILQDSEQNLGNTWELDCSYALDYAMFSHMLLLFPCVSSFNEQLNGDWFPPAEASLKRTLIQRLISELLQNRSLEVSSGGCSDEPQPNFPEIDAKESGLELVSDRRTPGGACRVNLSSSDPGQGIEITLLEASSGIFEPGVAAGPLLAQCPSFDQPSSYYHLNGAMSQIEQDDTETGEQFMYFPSGDTVFQQIAGMTPQDGSMPCPFRGFEADDSWNPGISLQAGDNDSSSDMSDCASDDSDVGIIENCPVKEDVGQCQKEKFDQQRSPLMEDVGCLASASCEMLENSTFGGIQNLEGTDDVDRIHDGNEIDHLASGQGNFSTSLQRDPDLVENVLHQDLEKPEVTQDDMQTIEGIHNLEGMDDADRIRYGNENANPASCQENLSASLQEDHALVENGLHQDLQKTEVTENDVQLIGDDVMLVESDEQQAAKRRRLTPPHEAEGGIIRSLSKDLDL